MLFNPSPAGYFHVQHSSLIFIQFVRMIQLLAYMQKQSRKPCVLPGCVAQ